LTPVWKNPNKVLFLEEAHMLPLVVLFFVVAKSYDWTEATTVLKNAVEDGAFPGYSALVAYKGKVLLRTANGVLVTNFSVAHTAQGSSRTILKVEHHLP
jgi:hypothetical protein